MKKLILLLTSIITFQISYSQGVCEYVDEKIDDMTGDTLLSTFTQIASGKSQGMGFTYRKVNSNYYIKMGYAVLATTSIVIGAKDKLIIKLQNDSLISLEAMEIASANHSNVGGIPKTQINSHYKVTLEQLRYLMEHGISKIRFYTTDSYIEVAAFDKEKQQQKMYDAIYCLLEHDWTKK